MDENGDAESNYTLLARKRHLLLPQEYGLYPVGVFTLKENDNKILVSKPAHSASSTGGNFHERDDRLKHQDFQIPMVTIRATRFNIEKLCILPTLCICCVSMKKQ
jgi:hypothetical protein